MKEAIIFRESAEYDMAAPLTGEKANSVEDKEG